LLRRMLALADTGTALAVAATIGLFGAGLPAGIWAALFVPFWIVAAKLYGLYDQDQRSLRHLTVDELPTILVWATTSIVALTFFLGATPGTPVHAAMAIRAWFLAVATALALRGIARLLWR